MPVKCPCCGATVKGGPLEEARQKMTPLQRRVLKAMEVRAGEIVSSDFMSETVYPSHPPSEVPANIHILVKRTNVHLKKVGWEIKGTRGPGGGYLLTTTQKE